VYYYLPIMQADCIALEWARGWTSQNCSSHTKLRAMAWANNHTACRLEVDTTSIMCTVVRECKKAGSMMNQEKVFFPQMRYASWSKLLCSPYHNISIQAP
jgi:hypothetical protein